VRSFSEGGSGGFFFSSADGRYILKTLSGAEKARLLRMLPRYYDYQRRSPGTLLCRYYGCYAVTIHSQARTFVVMESLFHSAPPIHERYVSRSRLTYDLGEFHSCRRALFS
jgi:1-phosphatidylinositol-4-phosphate 5-kinase